jgi:uncharacterized protein (DUF305 family)
MRTRPIAVTITALALAGLLAACAGASTVSSTGSSSGAGVAASTGSTTGSTADISFAQLMLPHHAQAIMMSDLAATNAASQEVKALAAQISAAQGPEMSTMTGWLAAWGVSEDMTGMDASAPANGDMDGMDMGGLTSSGMMSQADMGKLAKAKGVEFDRMYLQMMIAHHQGAVTMAQQVLDTTSNPQVRQLAQAIVDGQTKEIDTMQKLLAA